MKTATALILAAFALAACAGDDPITDPAECRELMPQEQCVSLCYLLVTQGYSVTLSDFEGLRGIECAEAMP